MNRSTIPHVRIVEKRKGRTTKHQVKCSTCGIVGVQQAEGEPVLVSAPNARVARQLARFHVDEAHAGAARVL